MDFIDIRTLVAILLLAYAAGCSRPPADGAPARPALSPAPGLPMASNPEPAAAAPAPAPLPRRDLTVVDRARWYTYLRWPQDCEDAFKQTAVTDDGGIEIRTLPSGSSIAIVRCALGAYQPTSVVLRFDERAPAARASLLEFATFESADGKTLAPARTRELSGEIAWLEGTNSFVVLTLARQIGDCGTWARYSVDEDAPRLAAFAAAVPCPDPSGQRVDPRPGEPPKGWKTIRLTQENSEQPSGVSHSQG